MTEAIDVTDETFETEVLDRSMEVPVVVDLWASWCGPCRTLGPVLEKLVAERDGEVVLAKVDVDANPRVAASFQVQSIPAVYALRNKRVVSGFIGAQPEPAVRAWLAEVAPAPTEVDQLIAAGDEASLRKALALEPANEKAIISLATVLIERGTAKARRRRVQVLLERVPETAEVRHLLAQARVGDEAAGGDEAVTAKLDALLDRVKDDPAAKQEYLDLLELMGDDPRVRRVPQGPDGPAVLIPAPLVPSASGSAGIFCWAVWSRRRAVASLAPWPTTTAPVARARGPALRPDHSGTGDGHPQPDPRLVLRQGRHLGLGRLLGASGPDRERGR